MDITENRNRFVISSEVKEKGRGAYYKIFEYAVKVIWSVFVVVYMPLWSS